MHTPGYHQPIVMFSSLFPLPLPELLAALSLAALCSFALLRARGNERRSVTLSLVLIVPGLLVMVAGSLVTREMEAPLFGSGVAQAGLLIFGLGLLRLFGQTLFQFAMVPFGLPRIIEDLMIFAFYIAWVLSRLHAGGMAVSQLLTTSAVVTAVLAFSLQDTLGNLLGGLALELDDAFELGDWIKVDDVAGRIVEVRWRSTSVETRNGETVVIPNSLLIRSRFYVVGKHIDQPLQWRRWIWFHVDYTIDPGHVIEVAETAVRNSGIPFVSTSPQASCLFMDFDQSSARFALRYWLTRLDLDDSTDSLVRCCMYAALKEADIMPAIPRQVIRISPTATAD